MRRQVEKYVLPYWRDRIFVEIKRADTTALLDMIEDKHGPAMADAILTTLRSIAGWVQKRNDDYVPPFVRGMRRVPIEVHNRFADAVRRRNQAGGVESRRGNGTVRRFREACCC